MDSSEIVFWLRLNVDADRAYFLRRKSSLLFAAWMKLLMCVKRDSPKKGVIKFTTVAELADRLRMLDEEVGALQEMIDGACLSDPDDKDDPSPALAIEGKTLRVVKWQQYQSPDAARKRKERDTSQEPLPLTPIRHGQTRNVTDIHSLSRTVMDSHGQSEFVRSPCHVTETETETELVGGLEGGVGGRPTDPDLEIEFRKAVASVPKWAALRLEESHVRAVLAMAVSELGAAGVLCQLFPWKLANGLNGKFENSKLEPIASFLAWIPGAKADLSKPGRGSPPEPEYRLEMDESGGFCWVADLASGERFRSVDEWRERQVAR